MKRSSRMLLMAAGDGRKEYAHPDRNGEMDEYKDAEHGAESRFRDRRGREHYDNGRYAPQSSGETWVDGRYWDDRHGYGMPTGHYPVMPTPYVPPVYERTRGGMERRTAVGRPMNRIGFALEGEMDRMPPEFGREYRTDAGHHQMDEMAYRRGSECMAGYGSGTDVPPLTREMAIEWMRDMKNADGTKGPHWTMEKTEEVRTQHNIECDPLEFYITMNMMYSDYVKAAEKINASSMDFYAYMSKAFLDDKDAQPDKLARYYWFVAEH